MLVADPTLDLVLRGVLLPVIAVALIVAMVRLNGLRSFSKMTSFDFLMTLAVASLLAAASQKTTWPAFVQTMLAVAALFAVQHFVARFSLVSDRFQSAVHNRPALLMFDGQMLDEALTAHRVTQKELFAQLRAHGITDPAKVHAVVMETTGDLSVVPKSERHDAVLYGVRADPSASRRRDAVANDR